MTEPFPPMEAALGTIMFRIMSESLTTGTPPGRITQLEAVRVALIGAWPDELKASSERTAWRTLPSGSVQALYEVSN